MFQNVCKHHLIVYGCLKFTFKKEGRIKSFEKKKIEKKKKKLWKLKISLSQIFRKLLLSRNNECSMNWATGEYSQLGDFLWIYLLNSAATPISFWWIWARLAVLFCMQITLLTFPSIDQATIFFLLKVAVPQKVLMHLSFPQTYEPMS